MGLNEIIVCFLYALMGIATMGLPCCLIDKIFFPKTKKHIDKRRKR